MNLFGIRGKDLTAIFKNGRESLEAFTKSMGTMSRESIARMSETQEKIERLQRALKETFYEKPLGAYANYFSNVDAAQQVSAAQGNAFEKNWWGRLTDKTSGGGTVNQQAKSDAAQIVSNLEGFLPAIKTAAATAKERSTWEGGQSDKEREYLAALANNLEAQVKRLEAGPTEKKPGLDIPLVKELLTSSSLQAIGGGDISSVLSGTIQANMLTAMQETAANTGKLAAGADAPKTTPSNVAK